MPRSISELLNFTPAEFFALSIKELKAISDQIDEEVKPLYGFYDQNSMSKVLLDDTARPVYQTLYKQGMNIKMIIQHKFGDMDILINHTYEELSRLPEGDLHGMLDRISKVIKLEFDPIPGPENPDSEVLYKALFRQENIIKIALNSKLPNTEREGAAGNEKTTQPSVQEPVKAKAAASKSPIPDNGFSQKTAPREQEPVKAKAAASKSPIPNDGHAQLSKEEQIVKLYEELEPLRKSFDKKPMRERPQDDPETLRSKDIFSRIGVLEREIFKEKQASQSTPDNGFSQKTAPREQEPVKAKAAASKSPIPNDGHAQLSKEEQIVKLYEELEPLRKSFDKQPMRERPQDDPETLRFKDIFSRIGVLEREIFKEKQASQSTPDNGFSQKTAPREQEPVKAKAAASKSPIPNDRHAQLSKEEQIVKLYEELEPLRKSFDKQPMRERPQDDPETLRFKDIFSRIGVLEREIFKEKQASQSTPDNGFSQKTAPREQEPVKAKPTISELLKLSYEELSALPEGNLREMFVQISEEIRREFDQIPKLQRHDAKALRYKDLFNQENIIKIALNSKLPDPEKGRAADDVKTTKSFVPEETKAEPVSQTSTGDFQASEVSSNNCTILSSNGTAVSSFQVMRDYIEAIKGGRYETYMLPVVLDTLDKYQDVLSNPSCIREAGVSSYSENMTLLKPYMEKLPGQTSEYHQ